MVSKLIETEYGVIPDDWTSMPIAEIVLDIADGPFGSNLKAEHYTEEHEVRIVQLSNIGEDGWKEENTKYTTFDHAQEISRSIVCSGEVIMAKMMPAGRAIVCPSKERMYVLSSDAIRIKLNEKIVDTSYFIYATKSQFFLKQIKDDIQGSTRARTSISKIKKNMMPFPELNEQVAIAEVLDGIDNLISSLQKVIIKKKNIKYGLLQTLLSPYDADNNAKKEWVYEKLDNVTIKIGVGLATSVTDHYRETGVPIFRNLNIKENYLDDEDLLFLDESFAMKNPNKVIHTGDVLTVHTGYVGTSCIVPEKYDGAMTFTTLITSVKMNILLPEYLSYHLNSPFGRKEVENLQASGGRNNLNVGDFEQYKIAFPSDIEEQRKIITILKDVDDDIAFLQDKLKKQKMIKKGMMSELLAGKIRLV